jgi:superfamily II DNA helicase RecQ
LSGVHIANISTVCIISNTVFTGTLPYNLELDFKQLLKLPSLNTIRARCLRENLIYSTLKYESSDPAEKLDEIKDLIINSQESFISSFDKIIVFASSVSRVLEVSSYLNCCFYHGLLSDEEKSETLSNFINNTSDYYKIIISTTGLQ